LPIKTLKDRAVNRCDEFGMKCHGVYIERRACLYSLEKFDMSIHVIYDRAVAIAGEVIRWEEKHMLGKG
jgi:hypothetical protein